MSVAEALKCTYKRGTLRKIELIVEREERYLNLGATLRGRVLLVVTIWRGDRVRVVTAFEPIKRLIQFYYYRERER
jgi:hypothetical protein